MWEYNKLYNDKILKIKYICYMLFKNSGITKLSQEEEINENKQRRNHKRMKR